MQNSSQELVNGWRNNAGADNPAGQLFVGGEFAEADIAGSTSVFTQYVFCNSGKCGTVCSGSVGHPCC